MKINNATKAATKPTLSAAQSKQTSKASKASPAVGKASPAPVSKAAVKVTLPGGLKWSEAIAVLTGQRGVLARQVQTATDTKTGKVYVKAVKNELGLFLGGKAIVCTIENGILCGDKIGLIQLGGYVNGKRTGAKISLTTLANFIAKSKPAIIHWNIDDNGVKGHYLGNPAQKGICAVYVPELKYAWHMETDANSNNKHERGKILPLTKEGKLASVSF